MPAIRWCDVKEEAVDPGFCDLRGPVVRGRQIEVGQLLFPAGGEIRPHALPREQILAICRGGAHFRIGDEERLVGPGEALLIRAGTGFSAQVLGEPLALYRFQDRGEAGPGSPGGSGGPAFFKWEEMTADFITPLYSSGQGPTITGERIEVAYMTYPAGTEGKPHLHPNEQIQVPLAGRVSYLLEEPHVATVGEVILIPANLRHGAEILEDFTVLNCKNIVSGWDVYNARWEKGEEGKP